MPQSLKYMYLFDSTHGTYSYRITRSRLDYEPGRRLEILLVLVGPKETVSLELQRNVNIKDDMNMEGFSGVALRPMVKKTGDILKDRKVTQKHALRKINDIEIDVRQNHFRTIVSDILNSEMRPIFLEFITIPEEYKKLERRRKQEDEMRLTRQKDEEYDRQINSNNNENNENQGGQSYQTQIRPDTTTITQSSPSDTYINIPQLAIADI